MFKRFSSAVAAAFLLCTTPVHAADYRLDFTVANLVPMLPESGPSPFNSGTGYAIFSADSPSSTWIGLKSFDFTIGNAHFALSDLSVHLYDTGGAFIGGLHDDAYGMESGTNDFWFALMSDQSQSFSYTSETKDGFWYAGSIHQTVSAVPEPETYAMLLAGLGLMGAVARRRKA